MQIIDEKQVQETLSFNTLIPLLKQKFADYFNMPQRQVFKLDSAPDNHDAFALLPAWDKDVIGTKAFTYFPNNQQSQGKKSLYSKIMLFSRQTGEPLALVDGTSITYWRTAAVSALASQLLSRANSRQLMLFGSGNLAPYLIKAHLSVRSIEHVIIAARSPDKGEKLRQKMQEFYPKVSFSVSLDIEADVKSSDIIICATSASEPLFNGEVVSAGSHIDCLGNHHANCRECDTTTMLRAQVYVDSLENTLKEAGELLIPINESKFEVSDIKGELADLCKTNLSLRQSEEEITLFKSVGTAMSDLVAAYSVYQSLKTK